MKNDISPQKEVIVSGTDTIAVIKEFHCIPGGRTLDLAGFTADTIKALHVIIKTAAGNYAPMPVTDASGDTYAKTADTAINSSKTYYTLSGGIYSPVASPVVGDIGDYYELTAGTAAAYAALPSGASYVGLLKHTISAKNPAASILVDAVVNSELIPYPMTDILSAFKAACPNIAFEKDEEA